MYYVPLKFRNTLSHTYSEKKYVRRITKNRMLCAMQCAFFFLLLLLSFNVVVVVVDIAFFAFWACLRLNQFRIHLIARRSGEAIGPEIECFDLVSFFSVCWCLSMLFFSASLSLDVCSVCLCSLVRGRNLHVRSIAYARDFDQMVCGYLFATHISDISKVYVCNETMIQRHHRFGLAHAMRA